MSEHVESVKAIASYLKESADRSKDRGNLDAAIKLARLADDLMVARDHMINLERLTVALPPDLGDIHDLPQELLDELNVAKTDEIEDQIVTAINAYDGEATLDQILVGLYRKFKVIQKRRFVQNKLYKMTMVWNVPGRKGVYTTTEPKPDGRLDDDSRRLLGDEPEPAGDIDSEIPF